MTNAEARFNKSLRPRKPEGSLGRTAQDVHIDSHTAPELCLQYMFSRLVFKTFSSPNSSCIFPMVCRSSSQPVSLFSRKLEHHHSAPPLETLATTIDTLNTIIFSTSNFHSRVPVQSHVRYSPTVSAPRCQPVSCPAPTCTTTCHQGVRPRNRHLHLGEEEEPA